MLRSEPVNGPWIVNVGLPRTGTTSFSRALELLGLRSLHIWKRAELDPTLLTRLKSNDPRLRRFLAQYHALSDTPFYALRNVFERHYPDALLVHTTRPKDDWIRSKLNFKTAGGEFLSSLCELRGVPYSRTDRGALGRLYDLHHATVCHRLPAIDLADPDSHAKWEVLCSAFPRREGIISRAVELEWPHANRFSVSKWCKPKIVRV